jgi:putative ABC transport system permease protein
VVTGGNGPMQSVRRGDTITLAAGGHTVTLSVVGTASTSIPGAGSVDALLSWDQFTALVGPGDDTTVMVKDAHGVSPTASRDALNSIAQAYPLVEVNSVADLSSSLDTAVNGMIALFGGLLGTAVLIALFGIANTLSLSVVERTRESATVRSFVPPCWWKPC